MPKREKLRYNKIRNFIDSLNDREKRYIKRKLTEELSESEVEKVNFTLIVDGKVII